MWVTCVGRKVYGDRWCEAGNEPLWSMVQGLPWVTENVGSCWTRSRLLSHGPCVPLSENAGKVESVDAPRDLKSYQCKNVTCRQLHDTKVPLSGIHPRPSRSSHMSISVIALAVMRTSLC